MGVGKGVGVWVRALGLGELCYGREGNIWFSVDSRRRATRFTNHR